jgi:hypothetical protein
MTPAAFEGKSLSAPNLSERCLQIKTKGDV